MYWRFDAEKFAMHQLPPLLRTKGIYALIRCLLVAVVWISRQFSSYRESVVRRLAGNGFTANLEHVLNSSIGLKDGDIYILDKQSDKVYLHYQEELADNIYIGYADEGDIFYLSSVLPDQIAGEFIVKVPLSVATESNLATVRKWVEYYRYAGTSYRIETYE